MRSLLQLAGALALLAIAGLFLTLSWVAAQVPRKLDNLQADVDNQLLFARGEIQEARKAALKQIEDARIDILSRSERQISALRVDTLKRVDTLSGILDLRVRDSVDAALTRVDGVIAIGTDLKGSLKPILENTAGITAHANEASAILFRRDALPAQLLGLTGAAKVTLGETAQTMRTVRDAAPKVAESIVGIGRSADGITADVHTVTSDFVKPKTFWQRVKGWLSLGATAGARLL